MVSCCVKTCKNDTRKHKKKTHNITFHRFPRNRYMLDAWLEAIKRPDFVPHRESCICSVHFKASSFFETKRGLRMVAEGAIPELNLPGQTASSSVQMEQPSEQHSQIPEGKVVILRVYNYLASEYQQLKSVPGNSSDWSALSDILQRTARATGVSEDIVTALLDEERRFLQHSGDNDATRRQGRIHVEDYYDCDSPIKEEEDCEEEHSASIQHDTPQPEQYVYHIDAVKQEVDEEHTEQLVIFHTDEDDEHKQLVRMNMTADFSCKSDTEMKTEPPDDVTPLSDSTSDHASYTTTNTQTKLRDIPDNKQLSTKVLITRTE